MDEQKQFVTDLVRTAQETQSHIHLVTHCRKPQSGDENKPPSKYDLRGAAAISDQVSNVAIVWANKKKKADLEANPNDIKALEEPDSLVIVDKQRNGIFEGKAAFWFDDRSLRFCDSRIHRLHPYDLEQAA
jgi:twinkle protein